MPTRQVIAQTVLAAYRRVGPAMRGFQTALRALPDYLVSAPPYTSALRKLTVDLSIIGLILAGLVLTVLEVWRPMIIIEPFSITEQAQDRGADGRVLANWLADTMEHFRPDDQSDPPRTADPDSLPLVGEVGSTLAIRIPGTEIPWILMIDYVKRLVGRASHRVSNDLVTRNNTFVLTTRLSGRKGVQTSGSYEELPRMLHEAAEYVFRHTRPIFLADHLQKEGRLRDALQLAAQNAYRGSKRNRAKALNLWGVVLDKQGDISHAREKFEEAAFLDSEFIVAHRNLAVAYRELGAVDTAIDILDKALSVAPTDPLLLVTMGDTYRNSDPERAMEFYSRCVDAEPKHSWALTHWGILLRDSNRFDEAVWKFKQSIALEPTNSIAYYNWAVLEVRRGNVSLAISMYEHALVNRRDFAAVYEDLWILWTAAGDHQKADDVSDRAKRVGLALDKNKLKARLESYARPN